MSEYGNNEITCTLKITIPRLTFDVY